MGATLEETLAELQSQQGTPPGSQSTEGSSAAGPGGGAPTASGSSPAPTGNPSTKQMMGAEKPFDPKQYQPYDTTIGAAVRGFTDAATFGFADEIGGALDTIGLDGGKNIWNSNEGFGDIYAANVAKERAILAGDREKHPWASYPGGIVGGLVIPISRIGEGIKGVAAAGAVTAGLYGVGSGETVEGRAVGGAAGTVVGGVLGGVLGKAGEMVAGSKLGRSIAARFSKEAPAAEEGLVGTVTDTGGPYNIPPEAIPPKIIALTEEGEPILGGLPSGEHQAPLNALVKTGDEATDAATQSAPKTASDGAESASTDLVPITAAKAGEGAEGASEETVGTIGREELEKLQAAVRQKAPEIKANERTADITWETSPDVAKASGEWRIGSLGGPEEARALLSGLARTVGGKETRSDVDLMREARNMANSIGEDPDAILGMARELAGTVGNIDSTMATLRTVWGRMSADVTDLHLMGVDWSTASDDLVTEAAQRIYNLQTLSAEVQKVKTGLGRGLRVQQLPTADAYLNRIAQRAAEGVVEDAEPGLNPLPETRQQISDWLEIWGATGGDPRRQAAILQGRVTLPSPGKYLRTSIANFFTANILSAPRTVMLNLIGPGVISTIRQVERHAGASLASINPLLTQQERAGARAVAQNAAKAWITTFTEVQDVFRMSMVAAQRNRAIIGGGGSAVDTVSGFGPINKNLRLAAQQGLDTPVADFAYGLGNAINVWPRAFARVNNGLDEFAKRMSYQAETRTDALVAAAQQGLDPEATTAYVTQRMTDAYNSEGHATSEELLRMAERSTLTGRVGEEGSKTRAVATAIQRARNAVPELRFILPVFNVAANGIAETMRRLPTAALPGLLGKGMTHTADELSGVYGAVAQADAHGRMLMGASFMTAGVMLSRNGSITGAGPQDPDDRRVWLATHQPYSIKIGGEWVRYDKYDILGGLLSIPATVHDATIYHKGDQEVSDIFMSGVGALAQWFKDKAALRNATGILALGDDPTKSAGGTLSRLGGNIASGLAIPAWMRTVITDTTSPELAMRKSWMDYIQAATPIWANDMEPIRNVLGEPVIKPGSSVGEAIFPVTTVKAIGYDEDPVLDELDRLYQVTGYGAGADSSALSYGHFDPKEVKLEDGKSLDYKAMQMRQSLPVDGKTLRQALNDLFNSPEYAQAVDADSQAKVTSRGDASRGYMVSSVFKRYNAAIKQEIAATSPKGRDWLVAGAAKRRDDAYLRDVSAKELVENPALYQAKGIDRGKLEEGLTGAGSSTGSLLEALQ